MTIITYHNGTVWKYIGDINIYTLGCGEDWIAISGLAEDLLLDNSWSKSYEKHYRANIKSIEGVNEHV